jgi:transcriptional regulator with XRE-family HTH domain
MATLDRPIWHMPQGQIALGLKYIAQGISLDMPNRPDSDAVAPADVPFYRLAGKRLQAIRKLAGVNQTEIAALLEVDQSTWSKWETGKRIPKLDKVIRFVARAQASLDLIYRGDPGGANPTLVALLRLSHPELLAREPIGTEPSRGTALASYRNSIQRNPADPE